MPEYLAPGVYVEEVDTGAKPIEGVSTSTAGMVGVTERGPLNVPILLTSYGDYERWFGQRLRHDQFGENSFLPHAIEGFFSNGGTRVYLVRVIDEAGAALARGILFDRGQPGSANTMLLRAAPQLSGTNGNPPRLYILDDNDLNAVPPDNWIRIGDGSAAEYRQVTGLPGAAGLTEHVALNFPLRLTHPVTAGAVTELARTADFGAAATFTAAFTLAENADLGDRAVVLDFANPADLAAVVDGQWLEIGTDPAAGADAEYHFVDGAPIPDAAIPTRATVRLRDALFVDRAAAAPVTPLSDTSAAGAVANLEVEAISGSPLIYVDVAAGLPNNRLDLILIQTAGGNELRRIGDLSLLPLSTGPYERYPESTIVENVALVDSAAALKDLTAEAPAGSRTLAVNNRVGLNDGDVIRIGIAPDEEYITIRLLPNRSPGLSPPDAGSIILTHPLNRTHALGSAVQQQNPPAAGPRQPSVTALDALPGDQRILVTDGNAYAANDFLRITTPTEEAFFHRLSAAAAAAGPAEVILNEVLNRAKGAGHIVVGRNPLFDVEALDPGAWGDRLRVSVEDEETGLVSRVNLVEVPSGDQIRLASIAGLEPGSVLALTNPDDGSVIGGLFKAVDIDRRNRNLISLNPGLTPAQRGAAQAAINAGQPFQVRSREFRLTVRLLRQPDPVFPARNDIVIDSEMFRHLSMDPRHSRYAPTIIGLIDGLPRREDRRPEGESRYIRLRDRAANANEQEAIRLGPEALEDVLPNGTERPARHPLAGGDDAIATLTADHFLGNDNADPEDRTGLFSLENYENISIVACPGQIQQAIQHGLINHCERMRYRFAVLDGPPPPADALTNIQFQRQQFDTKYAAIYHPWLLIPDPYPVNPTEIAPYPVPPSGSMIGIYARTDITRGVHKAPANEVVRGIIGLQRSLNKREHDILNPVNINVIRDFRRNNRGIRVWGGRVITSDPDWKYVNVRRLLIFIEQSIDLGLQWVVFEPNAEPLWARVRRAVKNFLTVVWRNGALEGTTPELGFYVKCDRTTMTQTDIDNGRLICEIGVAPVKPAEFVIVRIGLWTGNAEEN